MPLSPESGTNAGGHVQPDWVKASIPGGLIALAFSIACGFLWRAAHLPGALVLGALVFSFGMVWVYLWLSSEPRLAKARSLLQSLLVPGESVLASAVQRRLFALKNRRLLVAATSGRLISMQRHRIAGFHTATVRWQDLQEANVNATIFGANLGLRYLPSSDLPTDRPGRGTGLGMRGGSLEGLRKAEAHEVYRICQAEAQAWREKRRIRDVEELRAKSGGIQFGPQAAQAPQSGPPVSAEPAEDVVARLERAKTMLLKGLISDTEFESLKARIINVL